jgi:hypothetical protein
VHRPHPRARPGDEGDPHRRQGLQLRHGVALSGDERSLFVAETGKYRVWRIASRPARSTSARARRAEASIVFDNLPGYPDNLMRGQEGRIWLGFSGPRSAQVDAHGRQALPARAHVAPAPRPLAAAEAARPRDRVHRGRQGRGRPAGPFGRLLGDDGLTETADRLYVQNLHLPVLGWKPR